MNEKCLGWNEIPVKISASNAETANFATDLHRINCDCL